MKFPNQPIEKLIIVMFAVLCMGMLSCEKGTAIPEEEPEEADPLYDMLQADPTVFLYDGNYYLYGTNDQNPNKGFQVYTSTNLQDWNGPEGVKDGYALDENDVFGDNGFWAPQLWTADNKIYMAYTANEKIAIATSNSPLGPFTQLLKEPIASPVRQIDPFVFIDDDGKKYLFHVSLDNGNKIYVAELEGDFSAIKSETLTLCISASQPWENTSNVSWAVTEGPTVVKHEGLYYLVYSANDFRNPNYAVGYAVSDNIYGPWEKYEDNPILSIGNTGWAGSGHGDLFKDKDNKWFYVFHTHFSASQTTPRRTALAPVTFDQVEGGNDKIQIDGSKFSHLKTK